MEPSETNIALAMEYLLKLRWMANFPNEPLAIDDRARRLCKIVRNKSITDCRREYWDNTYYPFEKLKWDHEYDDDKKAYRYTGKDTKVFGTEDRNDLEWLIDRIGELYELLPSPIEMRRFYSEYLLPADGVRAQDMPTP